MQSFPLAGPGTPDLRSAARLLWRVVRLQLRTVLGGMVLGMLWMGGQALVPLVLVGLAVLQGASGVLRHRFAVANWMLATFRTTQGAPRSRSGWAPPSPTARRPARSSA